MPFADTKMQQFYIREFSNSFQIRSGGPDLGLTQNLYCWIANTVCNLKLPFPGMCKSQWPAHRGRLFSSRKPRNQLCNLYQITTHKINCCKVRIGANLMHIQLAAVHVHICL